MTQILNKRICSMTSKNQRPSDDRITQLRILINKKFKISDFSYKVEIKRFGYTVGSQITKERVYNFQGKFHADPRHDKNDKLAMITDKYNLLTYYTYMNVIDNSPSRSGRITYQIYHHNILIQTLKADWYYAKENKISAWEMSLTFGRNGQDSRTNKEQTIDIDTPRASFTAFVGGAMDKYKFSKERFERYIPKKYEYLNNPTNIMLDCLTDFKKILPSDVVNASFEYYGYEEAYGNYSIGKKYGDHPLLNLMSDIKEILKKEPKTQINLVGHSLGGWNVAGLAEELSKNKICKVNCLITIDPVGTRLSKILLAPTPMGFVGKADIYIFEPDPISNIWINVYSKPTTNDDSDIIADFGGRWYDDDTAKATYQVTSSAHHYQAQTMLISSKYFKNNTHSASDILINELKKVSS